MIVRTFFLLFTASVRSRPPGPPAVPGVLYHSSNSCRTIFMTWECLDLKSCENWKSPPICQIVGNLSATKLFCHRHDSSVPTTCQEWWWWHGCTRQGVEASPPWWVQEGQLERDVCYLCRAVIQLCFIHRRKGKKQQCCGPRSATSRLPSITD